MQHASITSIHLTFTHECSTSYQKSGYDWTGLQILAQAAARGPQLYELGEVLGQALLSTALDEGADDAVHGRDERQRVLNRQLRLASLG